MKKEKFVRAYLNSKPLPLENIVEARQMEARRAAMAARVKFAGTIDTIDIDIDTKTGRSRVKIYTPHAQALFQPSFTCMVVDSALAVLTLLTISVGPLQKTPTQY